MTGTRQDEPVVRLRAPHHRVERKAILLWTLRSLVWPGSLLLAAIIGAAWWEPARAWLVVPMVGLAVLTAARVLVEPWWRYAVHRWEITDEAVYGLTGWVVREWRVAPISRVQTVDAVRGPLEQLLGLATLRVTTASSRGAIDIGGLDAEVAADLAARLTTIAQLTPGDAT